MATTNRGQAIVGYATVAALLGIAMLGAMSTLGHAAGENIVSTQTGLSNDSKAP